MLIINECHSLWKYHINYISDMPKITRSDRQLADGQVDSQTGGQVDGKNDQVNDQKVIGHTVY